MGLLAAFYSVLITQFAYQRRRLANKYWIMKIPYFYPVLVVLLFATLTFPDFSIPPASVKHHFSFSNFEHRIFFSLVSKHSNCFKHVFSQSSS